MLKSVSKLRKKLRKDAIPLEMLMSFPATHSFRAGVTVEGYEAALDEIEKEVSERFMELPVDADGEAIHVRDVMEWPITGETFEVVGIGDGTLFYVEDDGEYALADWTGASTKRHHHEPTVEDVLRQVIASANNGMHIHGALDTEQIVAEYAGKLKLASDK